MELKKLATGLKVAATACLLGASVLTAACGGSGSAAPTAQELEAQAKAEAEAKAKAEAEAKAKQGNIKVDTKGVVVADDNFANLQLTDARTPVYDKYTLEQRRKLGLPTALPKLAPFSQGKIAYLTFDDGPDPYNTVAILNILKDEGVPATFYLLGTQVREYPEIVKRIYNEHHAIANHSFDHDYDKLYASTDAFLAEMEQNDEEIYKILGLRPMNLRAPGGTFDSFTVDFWNNLNQHGYVEHDWNVCCEDAVPTYHYAPELIAFVERDLKQGMESAIVLMHSTAAKDETVKALPGIIRALRERGYSFGVMSPMTPQPYEK